MNGVPVAFEQTEDALSVYLDMADLAEPMLKAFPEILESTSKVEIGLNFVK